MKKIPVLILAVGVQLSFTVAALPQGISEYGRSVGSIPQGIGPRAPGTTPPSGSVSGGVGETTKALPLRLIVAVKDAGLYPKTDDESEKVAELAVGETLVPMVQSSGANDWFMVRTQKGAIGWVKSIDVREDKAKK